MLFIPDEIDTVMLLREPRKDAEAMLFGAAAHIIGVAGVEGAIAFAGDDVGVEH